MDTTGKGLWVDSAAAVLQAEKKCSTHRSDELESGDYRWSKSKPQSPIILAMDASPGNQAPACLSRRVSMYLVKNVGGWRTTRIGRLYNGRHHTTVLHAIQKIERLRQTDESMDALIEVITVKLRPGTEGCFTEWLQRGWTTALIDAVADRVLKEIRRLTN
jgi:hypothetical protein